MLDILRILTAILALGLGAWLFNRDTNRLVLVPIDRMMQKVGTLELKVAGWHRHTDCCVDVWHMAHGSQLGKEDAASLC